MTDSKIPKDSEVSEDEVKSEILRLSSSDSTTTTTTKTEDKKAKATKTLLQIESILGPLLLTGLAFFVRTYRIGANDHVVWDEAHFGKFGSYYLRHEFYHDVHPPLGKILVGFSGYLAGYNGSWDFPSGETYPEYIDYVKMRIFQTVWSTLCVPLAYFTMKEIGFNMKTRWLLSLMVALELTYTTLGKFILLDSMLLFFIVSTTFCLARFHSQNIKPNNEFKRKWWKWILLTGISAGCACSVKMVGLFVTSVVGVYTVVDLWYKLSLIKSRKLTWFRYICHWLARIVALIIIPFCVFALAFKVHFDLLSGSGTGDAVMSSLFQANLRGSELDSGPRDVMTINSEVTLKSQGLGGGLLHSHVQTYPSGSQQQQVTTYSHKDGNNNWGFELIRTDPRNSFREPHYVVDGMAVRIVHKLTNRNLHTHEVPAPVTSSQFEVSGYGNDTIGDAKDNWIIEFVDQPGTEDKLRLHPITTSFRLRSEVLGCYLAAPGVGLPAWGFRQGEVICMKDPFKRDKRTWWNIEMHNNPDLPLPAEDFKYPKTNFFRDFIQLNVAMMATNNALVPDPEKKDDLSSQAWQWPTLNVGIRLCGWGDDNTKYFLIGSPATTWTSSVGLIVFIILVISYGIRYLRQINDFPEDIPTLKQIEEEEKSSSEKSSEEVKTIESLPKQKMSVKLNKFLISGLVAFFGWFIHFIPFLVMGRVLYVHHYLPTLYFAMIVFCYMIDLLCEKINKKIFTFVVYLTLYSSVIATFIYFSPLTFGMDGPPKDFEYLDLLPTWRVARNSFEV